MTRPTEAELARRFALRSETFAHGALTLELILPRAADELIDEADFDADERLPYWADLWPSARALARRLLDDPPHGPVLELGAGLALPSLALLARGARPLATDWYEDALHFARVNAERNRLGSLPTARLDWRRPDGVASFPLVVAADVLYEARNAEDLARALPALVSPGGSALLADPGRAHRSDFLRRMESAGWRLEEDAVREPHAQAPAGAVEIRMLRLTSPAGDAQNR